MLDEQVHRELGRRRRDVRVDAALEALGRLARQLVPTGGSPDGAGVEVRRLDEHVGGGVVHLGVFRAHHASYTQAALLVGDNEHLLVQLAGVTVEHGHLLVWAGAAHHDAAAYLLCVEGVDRLAGLQHRVVGRVHDAVHRAHPGGVQAAAHL